MTSVVTQEKIEVQTSAGKVMASVFWEKMESCSWNSERDAKINSERYVQTLKLQQRIRKDRPNRKISQGPPLHGNTKPYTSVRTREAVAKTGWTVFPHPPHSPHFAPSDFHLFGPWRVQFEDAVLRTTTSWNTARVKSYDLSKEFYAIGKQRLTERWYSSIDNGCTPDICKFHYNRSYRFWVKTQRLTFIPPLAQTAITLWARSSACVWVKIKADKWKYVWKTSLILSTFLSHFRISADSKQ